MIRGSLLGSWGEIVKGTGKEGGVVCKVHYPTEDDDVATLVFFYGPNFTTCDVSRVTLSTVTGMPNQYLSDEQWSDAIQEKKYQVVEELQMRSSTWWEGIRDNAN